MTIIDKRTDNVIFAQDVTAGQVFTLADDEEEYFMKIAKGRLHQIRIEVSDDLMNSEIAVRLSDGIVCRINPLASCYIYPQAELIIKN